MLSASSRFGFVLALCTGALAMSCSSGSDSTDNLGAGATSSTGGKATGKGGSSGTAGTSAAAGAGGTAAAGASTSTGGTTGGASPQGTGGNSAAGISGDPQGTGGSPTMQGAGGATPSAGQGGTPASGGYPSAGLDTSDDITIIVEPSDHGDGVVNAIKGATKSVHMVMYLLTDSDTINALIARAKAGIEVKVLLNQTFPTGTTDSNAKVYTQLMTGGVQVEWAPSQFTFTHEKCVIIDSSVAWIMTMNLTNSSPTANREYLAIDTGADDVAEADAIFQGDWANAPIVPTGKLVVSPNNSRHLMIDLLNTATSTVDLEGEELSDTAIVAALAAAADGGLKVRIVLASGDDTAAQTTAVAMLKQHNIPVVGVTTPYIHAKAIVVDGARAYIGSENFTAGSLGYNRELGILTAKTPEVAKVQTTISADFAAGTAM